MRYLAIDLGDRRTGLAVGDDETFLVSPAGTIETGNTSERHRQLLAAIAEQQPDALVVGWPLNMDGSVGPAAKKIQQAADQLGKATGLEVHLVDERLTSADADDQMARTGWTHGQKKARRDALAAANILRKFLDIE
jgi:putative Holliday junction resolvase